MGNVVLALKKSKGGRLGIDRATNVLALFMCNVIVHALNPLFVAYLRAYMRLEATANVISKIKGVLQRLEPMVGLKCC